MESARLEVDGYRFEIRVLNDASVGPDGTPAWRVSAVPGVGASCVWTRTASALPSPLVELWGTPGRVADLARWNSVEVGTSGNRQGGLPTDAWSPGSPSATVACAVRDQIGVHGVAAKIDLDPRGAIYLGSRLHLTPWRG